MEEFLSVYPDSAFSNPLCAALGDLFLREKNYSSALNYYIKINDADLLSRVFLSRMQCLYYMEWYATLADECEAFLTREEIESSQRLQTTYYLAIALYQQCLNAAKEPEALQKLALRAQPYFETLFQSELNNEVAAAFAHLCCILKDFPKASSIYLDLAKKNSGEEEEMLFQAALIQAEYDKELASQTFGEIVQKGKNKEKEAAYNRLVLAFDLKKYEQLVQAREEIFRQIPPDRAEMAHLFLGRSFLALKKYSEANEELRLFIANAEAGETLRAALVSSLDASFQSNDLPSLDFALSKMKALYPADPEIPKSRFSRSLMLKRVQRTSEARAELESLLAEVPQFPQRAQASFELAHLDYQSGAWLSCRERVLSFLAEFPGHELSPFAWRYLISSSAELSSENPKEMGIKQQLASDIEMLLGQRKILSPSERHDWEFLLAKTNFEMNRLEDAMRILEELTAGDTPFSHEGNASLLLALCYRDSLKNLDAFCSFAERAIEKKANLMDLGSIHASLFNAYLLRSETNAPLIEKAADHLFAAFEAKAPLQKENIFWLADLYYNQIQNDLDERLAPSSSLVLRAVSLLEHIVRPSGAILQPSLSLEPHFCKLGRLYSHLDRKQEAVVLLEKLAAQYHADPTSEWKCEREIDLLLGECYAAGAMEEEALRLFDVVAKEKSTLRTRIGASASLQSARLRTSKWLQQRLRSEDATFSQILSQLKDLVLQRTLANEPLHLEAALDYIELQAQVNPRCPEKRIALLDKAKKDFESTGDLLSKDYHEARSRNPRKDKIFHAYMLCIEAEILVSQSNMNENGSKQKELQAKAKDLLLQIIDENAHPMIVERARKRLENAIISEQKT